MYGIIDANTGEENEGQREEKERKKKKLKPLKPLHQHRIHYLDISVLAKKTSMIGL